MNEKFFRLFVAFLGLLSILAWTDPVLDTDFENSHLDEQEALIRERIPTVVTIVSPTYNPAVRSYLNTYIYRRPEMTANMLGWAKYYFPIFEKALQEEGLPTDLKYLAIVESALNPNAISRSGAGGLWQFMKPTAKECGLKCGTYVDERMDPEKASKAAAHYLRRLYDMFGNWELVMAAYNAGPGRIRSAVKRAGTSDYWKMARYLPVETQSYVPGFIAASYLMNFYSEHDIIAVDPVHALGELTPVMMHEGMHLSELARRSGLTMEIIKSLNPSFVRNYIPASTSGYTIWLPAASAELFHSGRSMEAPAVDAAVNAENAMASADKETFVVSGEIYKTKTVKRYYTVRSGDNLYNISKKNGCTVKELMTWNRLKSSRIAIGQKLEIRKQERVLIPAVVEKVEVVAFAARENIKVDMIPSLMVQSLPDDQPTIAPVTITVRPNVPVKMDNSIVLKRRQSVRQALGEQTSFGSHILMPNNAVAGDVVKWRSKA